MFKETHREGCYSSESAHTVQCHGEKKRRIELEDLKTLNVNTAGKHILIQTILLDF
jgi:hypothetical protein